MDKQAILAVSFGTSHFDTLEKTIAEGLLTVVVFNVLEKYSKTELETLCVL